MSKPIESVIECPFYIQEGKQFIRCEGVIKGTQTVHAFKTPGQKLHYELNVCGCFGGSNCPHYRTVFALYDNNGGRS